MRITAIPPLPLGVDIAAIDDENIEYIMFSYFENEAEYPPRFELFIYCGLLLENSFSLAK